MDEPGEWQHGWQCWASSISDSFFWKTSLLPVRPEASGAHLRSHSGSNAGTALAYAPTSPEYTIPPHLFRVIVLERLKLQLPVGEASCTGCGALLDPVCRHRVSCPRTGRVKTRAGPIERVLEVFHRGFTKGFHKGVSQRDFTMVAQKFHRSFTESSQMGSQRVHKSFNGSHKVLATQVFARVLKGWGLWGFWEGRGPPERGRFRPIFDFGHFLDVGFLD